MHSLGFAVVLAAASVAAGGERPGLLSGVRIEVDEQKRLATLHVAGIGRPRADLRGTQARLMAERGARVVAARNLLVVIQELREGRRALPGRHRIAGTIRNQRYGATEHLPDGTVRVWVQADLALQPSTSSSLGQPSSATRFLHLLRVFSGRLSSPAATLPAATSSPS